MAEIGTNSTAPPYPKSGQDVAVTVWRTFVFSEKQDAILFFDDVATCHFAGLGQIKSFGKVRRKLKNYELDVCMRAYPCERDYPTEKYEMFTIYERPTDYPFHYVVRRWDYSVNPPATDAEPMAFTSTLAEARGHIPVGRTHLGRDMSDPMCVVESWI